MKTTARIVLALILAGVLASSAIAQECYQPDSYLPVVGNPGPDIGNCVEVEVLQSWAYVVRAEPEPRTLVVWSLHDPEMPVEVASVPLPEGAQHLRAQGNRLYFSSVTGYYAFVHIWDVSDPYSPTELGKFYIQSQVLDLEVEGDLLAMTTSHFFLSFYNVADPANPTWLSDFLPAPQPTEITDVELFPTHAVCAVRGGVFGVSVVSTLNPSSPVLTMFQHTGVWLRGFTMEDNGQFGWGSDSDSNLYRVDLVNPGPVLTHAGGGGSRVTVFDDLVITMGPWGSYSRVYVQDGDGVLSFRDRWPYRASDIARKGNYLVAAIGSDGLHVRQLTPEVAAPYVGMVHKGSWRYIAPRLGPTDTPGLMLELNHEQSRLDVIDYTDPAHAAYSGSWGCDDPMAAAARGEDLVIGYGGGVRLLRLAANGSLTDRGMLWPDYELESLLWDGDLLWLGSVPADLSLYDMTDPTAPVLVYEERFLGRPRNLARMGDYLIIGAFLGGLFVLDVSTPAAPVLVAHLENVVAEFMTVWGDHVYIASRFFANVEVISLADPAMPVVVDTLPLTTIPQAILVHDHRLWVAARNRQEVFQLIGGLPEETSLNQGGSASAGDFELAGELVVLSSDYTVILRPPCLDMTSNTPTPVARLQGLPAVPNPFNPQTTIRFEITRRDHTRLSVYDLRGHLVTTLVDEPLSTGIHEVVWRGRDAKGKEMPSGVYLSRLECGGKTWHGRMTLIR